MSAALSASQLEVLACPHDRGSLTQTSSLLTCASGHAFPVIDGIPVFVAKQVPAPERERRDPDHEAAEGIHPYVNRMIGSTCGHLYSGLVGRLSRYPIPVARLDEGEGRRLVDIGCNWGRWTVAAARKGYRVTGLDLSLEALRAARVVARQCGISADFVCGDARAMPFADEVFDHAYSYSVLQHFSKDDVVLILRETARTLASGGKSTIQMPNAWGIRSLFHQLKRGHRRASGFDVRYWTQRELRTTFEAHLGPSRISVDGFFGLNVQASDLDLMPARYRLVIRASEALRWCARRVPRIASLADSVYVKSNRNGAGLLLLL
jgi:2-polyprenyl-3-methyl-5-hydroxy-6-metoxy-1,4-benzoquinol methylase/uncharacterized protein YbaR (Trm112 family)